MTRRFRASFITSFDAARFSLNTALENAHDTFFDYLLKYTGNIDMRRATSQGPPRALCSRALGLPRRAHTCQKGRIDIIVPEDDDARRCSCHHTATYRHESEHVSKAGRDEIDAEGARTYDSSILDMNGRHR